MKHAPKTRDEAVRQAEAILSKFFCTVLIAALDRDDEGDEAIWLAGVGLQTHREGLMRRAFGKMFPEEADHKPDDDEYA